MIRAMSRVLAAALAVVMLVQAFIAGGLVVACTTASGNVELEWALAVCCDQTDGHGDSDETSDSVHDAGCSCSDALIAAPDARVASSNLDHANVLVLAPTPTPTVELVVESAGRREVRPESSAPPQPRRAILVLRC